ncbi:MAG: aminotransferase class V-fold PLP-dependent enzyme, partial [Actinobacteria bacterium]|nr:aminotransferase class V-fold PLP-dependent enzyme [Actinomycetota bacterium]
VVAVKEPSKSLGDEYRDVIIDVQEKGTGSANLFFGFNSTESAYGGLNITENNFNHRGLLNWWHQGVSKIRGGGERFKRVFHPFTTSKHAREQKCLPSCCTNVLGTINPVRELCDAAHRAGAIAVVDGCQSVPHMTTDVQAWGADMLAFSSHKMCGPTGVGVFWAPEAMLDSMPPFLGGGGMISDVRLDSFTCAELPAKFEAGTPPIVEVIGLGAAVDFLSGIGMSEVRRHEIELTNYAYRALKDRYGDDITIHGATNPELRGATFSFAFRGVHPHDVSQVLDQHNVYVRAGHHCAKPLMRLIGANATARASMYLYSDENDVDALVDALDDVSSIF